MSKPSNTQNENAQSQPAQTRYRLVNNMLQKLVVNVIVEGAQESLELGTKEKSRPFQTKDLGPHVEVLRRNRHLTVEAV